MRAALLVGASVGAAAQGTRLLNEPFGTGWTAGASYLTYSTTSFIPAARNDATEVPTDVLRLIDTGADTSTSIEYLTPQTLSCGINVRCA